MIERVGKDGGYGRYVDDFVVISRDKKNTPEYPTRIEKLSVRRTWSYTASTKG